jgi:FKBP-type peptidyl-prolyl cis-trans isomerase (trigger factor)
MQAILDTRVVIRQNEEATMSKEKAKEFFDQLENSAELRAKIRLGLETLTKIAAGFDVTEEELDEELQRRWECKHPHPQMFKYSEPAGF